MACCKQVEFESLRVLGACGPGRVLEVLVAGFDFGLQAEAVFDGGFSGEWCRVVVKKAVEQLGCDVAVAGGIGQCLEVGVEGQGADQGLFGGGVFGSLTGLEIGDEFGPLLRPRVRFRGLVEYVLHLLVSFPVGLGRAGCVSIGVAGVRWVGEGVAKCAFRGVVGVCVVLGLGVLEVGVEGCGVVGCLLTGGFVFQVVVVDGRIVQFLVGAHGRGLLRLGLLGVCPFYCIQSGDGLRVLTAVRGSAFGAWAPGDVGQELARLLRAQRSRRYMVRRVTPCSSARVAAETRCCS